MNHVLICDDSPVDRRLAGGIVSQQGNLQIQYASNGIEAVELVEEQIPLVVITDLQMPEMNGLQVVATMRRRFPHVPVILMTATGSEESALEALLAGAADFVPKSRLATDLWPAIEGVLAVAGSDRVHNRLTQCLSYEHVHYDLDNDLLLIAPLVMSLQQSTVALGLVEAADKVRFARALVEALRNAIIHGNLELGELRAVPATRLAELIEQRKREAPFDQRRVLLRAELTRDLARFSIRDNGSGFDVHGWTSVHDDPALLVRGEGRGLVLMHTFMDEVTFSAAGNEVTLIKRRRVPPAEGQLSSQTPLAAAGA